MFPKIQVTNEHIELGESSNPKSCAIAIAFKDTIECQVDVRTPQIIINSDKPFVALNSHQVDLRENKSLHYVRFPFELKHTYLVLVSSSIICSIKEFDKFESIEPCTIIYDEELKAFTIEDNN